MTAPTLLPLLLALAAGPQEAPGLAAWPAEARAAELALEDRLLAAVEPESLGAWHELCASRPHDAGTPGDAALVEHLARSFEELGLEVERHEIHVLLATPVAAELEILTPERRFLPLRERPLPEDPYTMDAAANEALRVGWNAYSGSGEVAGQVVYANYGRKEDFAQLREQGVDCTGKIVLARYGGNYRGYKAKFAEEAGAAGLVIFVDPADSGYARGLPYPEGGYANESQIQRGSIKTLPYFGDPTTPFRESTADAERVPLAELDLPRIPVQPVGWGAAREILGRMKGASVPGGWQGGLPFRYRMTGGPELRVRLKVEQERRIQRTWNVLGTLRGAEQPEKRVVLGAHHDAWGYGASDPACGLICVLEAARAWSAAAAAGHRPRRSITFAAWGAEEFGIIGSVEWVESRLAELTRDAVCYLNMDMAATGPRFGSSSSPSLRRAIADALARVPQARDESGRSVLELWRGRAASPGDPELPAFGSLGGGSDHVGFIALAGVPCASLGAGGSAGTCYHSIYDTLAWYRKIVGDDYEPARMVARAAAVVAARFADAPLLPLDPAQIGAEARRHLAEITRRGRATGLFEDGEDGEKREVAVELARVEAAALQYERRARQLQVALEEATAEGALAGDALRAANRGLQELDRVWLDARGLPGRPWFRNLYAATDEDSGYAAWVLPGLRYAVEHADPAALEEAEGRYMAVFERAAEVLTQMERTLPQVDQRNTAPR